jgi:Ni/Fe-hydrogenase subunit HybB-like protein
MSGHAPQSVRKPFFTPGAFVLIVFTAIGLSFGLARLFNGLGPITNLNDFYPWGIWIAIDVACGVALAAGGFTTAAIAEIFGGHKFKPLLRPAILTAWLGYFMVAIGLMFDLGRYWNVWRPIFNWQGNSVLFEVGMCVMAYLAVLTVEMSPALIEGLRERIARRDWGHKVLAKVEKPLILIHSWVKAILPIFIVAGVVLSCMHQSSLGTLMVIAPTKVSALWYTPFMPLLFLLSAMMVGFPMVIVESIIAHKSFGKEQDLGLIGSLAKYVPYVMGVYAAFKFGDLIVRWKQLNFTEHADATVFWAVEIVLGVLAPLVLFSLPAVRRSINWLLTASLLVVGGVVLNRINVYVVGYYPPFAKARYFPAIGEIALTVGLACALMLLYRFFAIHFPIVAGDGKAAPVGAEAPHRHHVPALKPVWTAVFRGTAVAFLLGFVVLYSLVHTQAIQASAQATQIVRLAKIPQKPALDTSAFRHAARPDAYRSLYVLNSQELNGKTDYYEPVRFTHRTHEVNADSNCAVCHHRYASGPEDRIGQDLKQMHADIEVRIQNASCLSCHEDLTDKEFGKCSQCHFESNEPDYPARIGLKGAYHRQCIGCHQTQPDQAKAPTDCAACHHPLVPDHKTLLNLTARLSPAEVTSRCLVCHENTGADILKTAHWNWQGPTSALSGKEHSKDIGLKSTIDNYDISLAPNPAMTSAFHIGGPPTGNGGDDPAKIDCLVCHDTTGLYKRGMDTAWLDAKTVAENIGRPSRANCGACHFYGGGGAGVKNGDLSPAMVRPKPEDDTHMGKVDMRCQDCHATEKHQIAGHIDDHVKAIACETCHIPQFARSHPTQLSVDFSTAGKDGVAPKLQFNRPTYDKRYGTRTWGQDVVPVYRWFDGTRQTYLLGDKIDPSKPVVLNAPLGEKQNIQARIYPFKVHQAVQPYDAERNILAAVKFEDGLWKDYDWTKAVADGMAAVGQSFSGKVGFVKTEMYSSVHHEVAPAKESLGCADCHAARNVTCVRCHTNAAGMNQPEHTKKVYPGTSDRFDFKALGYEGDPAVTGGRFYIYLKRGLPPR